MGGLLGLLDLGAGALAAQSAGVSVAGRNTANVNTEGYSRESVDLNSQMGAPMSGVSAGGLSRAADSLLANRERMSSGAFGQADATSSALSSLEHATSAKGTDLVQAFAALFGGIMRWSAAPADSALRSSAVQGVRNTAQSFRQMAAAISQARSDSNQRVAILAAQASQYAQQIATANQQMTSGGGDPVIADKRDLAARKLADLVGGQARVDSDGMMRFVAGSGTVLVDGTRASTLKATPDAAYSNYFRLDAVDGTHVVDMTKSLDGGRIAGELAFRDGTGAQAASNLDALAFTMATQMNAVHQANAGLDGNVGRDIFTAPTQQDGAAAAMTISAALDANPSLLAGAAPGSGPTDNTGALALAAVGDQLLAGGGTRTLSDQAIQNTTDLGLASKAASDTRDYESAKADVLKSARDSLSGVSTEEELQKLAQYQNAHEAAAKFLSTVNDLLGNLLQNL